MRFDLFYELAVSPQLGRSEARAYAETLAQLELADRPGFARGVMPALRQDSGSKTPDSAEPLINCRRAAHELGWRSSRSAADVLRQM